MERGSIRLPWTKLHPKVMAAAVVGGAIYVLGAFGVDLSDVVQDVENAVGIDIPDTQAFVTLLAGLIAGYAKRGDTGFGRRY